MSRPASLLRLRAMRRDVAERALGEARRQTEAAVQERDARTAQRQAARRETGAAHDGLTHDPNAAAFRLALLAEARKDEQAAAERVLAAERAEAQARYAEDERRAAMIATQRRHDSLAARIRDDARAKAIRAEEREALDAEHRRPR